MKPLRIVFRAANAFINFLVVSALFLAGAYSCFALWDNSRIYSAAKNVQADMLKLKPDTSATNPSADFSQLLQINPDICAWISMDGTKIQYPVVQGETNLSYINQDIYGDFALAGSIYLDARNSANFTDTYSLLYGHHMDGNRMFGDLDLYKDAAFFEKNHTGALILPQQTYTLEILSCLLVNASDEMIFLPTYWQPENQNELFAYIAKHALHIHPDLLDSLMHTTDPVHLLALSTCSAEFTDARTIVIAIMYPSNPA